MKQCQAKRGFFSLYDCPKQGVSTCKRCRRLLCHEHLPQNRKICYECASQAKLKTADSYSIDKQITDTYRLRTEHLKNKDNKTIYFGTDLGDYYSSYDIRTFDIELSNIADMADSPDELYFDS